MITEPQYLDALRIVAAYHRQIGLHAELPTGKTLDNIGVGDYISYLRRNPKYHGLTPGLHYLVIRIKDTPAGSGTTRRVWLRTDRGTVRSYLLNALYWKVS